MQRTASKLLEGKSEIRRGQRQWDVGAGGNSSSLSCVCYMQTTERRQAVLLQPRFRDRGREGSGPARRQVARAGDLGRQALGPDSAATDRRGSGFSMYFGVIFSFLGAGITFIIEIILVFFWGGRLLGENAELAQRTESRTKA